MGRGCSEAPLTHFHLLPGSLAPHHHHPHHHDHTGFASSSPQRRDLGRGLEGIKISQLVHLPKHSFGAIKIPESICLVVGFVALFLFLI